MAIRGRLSDGGALIIKVFMSEGKIGDVPYKVTRSASKINIEMMGKRVTYLIEDMVRDAHKKIESRTKRRSR